VLLPWSKRTHKTLGEVAPQGGPIPIIDMIHRLMQLWKAGDQRELNGYIIEHSLQDDRFLQVLQAIIELPDNMDAHNSHDRSILESISNHITGGGVKAAPVQGPKWTPQPLPKS
jgi:hypothetical protein